MNIFMIHNDPHAIARHYPDIHLRKMMIEYVQLLSNAWEPDKAVYKRTHYNHPSSKWARDSRQNYEWLYSLVHSMGAEYFNRFGKRHLSEIKLRELPYHAPHLEYKNLTPPPQVMPDEYKEEDSVIAYRRYYAYKLKDFRKRGMCKFTNRKETYEKIYTAFNTIRRC